MTRDTGLRGRGADNGMATRHGAAQHGAAQHGAAQHGAAQHGAAQHGAAQHGAAQHGAAQHGAVRRGLARGAALAALVAGVSSLAAPATPPADAAAAAQAVPAARTVPATQAVPAAQAALATRAVSAAQAAPPLQVTTVVSGLAHPWDLTWVGDLLLYDLRSGQVWSKRGSAAPRRVAITGFPSIFAQSEGGLMGMVADPDAATNRRFYTCQSVQDRTGNPIDIRVLRWRMTSETTATADGKPVITGIPITTGQHSGCRLRFGADGTLHVSTGDAIVGSHPQDLSSLGGKVLRVNSDGTVPRDNPFVPLGGNARLVWTFGHRNMQGLALRPGTAELWSAEHGPNRDDEVNLLRRGANYGWNPVPGYDQNTPMTDLGTFPDAVRAPWSSGVPTLATSGATFLSAPGWGRWRGGLAVALLKGQGVLVMHLDPATRSSRIVRVARLPAAEGLGRIRTAQQGPDGALWLTTSSGADDRIIRILPTPAVPVVAAGSLVSGSGAAVVRDGAAASVFVRSAGDAVLTRASTDDGVTWSAWASTGVSSTSAPSACSARPGRIDLFSRSAAGTVVHTWFVDGVRAGSADLGGNAIAAHGTSLGDGTLDVFAVGAGGGAARRHFDGTTWGAWTDVEGTFTSGLSASADRARSQIVVSGRATNGATYERRFTPSGVLGSWARLPDGLSAWSGRALGDAWPGRFPRVAVGLTSDGYLAVQRGGLVLATAAPWTGPPDVASRPDGSFLAVGRGPDDALWVYDGRPGGFAARSLGGVVR
jgi:glucose/arabinose dehydrogenase